MLLSPVSLSPDDRAKLMAALTSLVIDGTDLAGGVHLAHWNVEGPLFMPLHKLFEDLYEALYVHVNDIAERVRQLGGQVRANAQTVGAKTTLPPYPEDLTDAIGHVRSVLERAMLYLAKLKEVRQLADSIEEADTFDLLTSVIRDLDKRSWMVAAHDPAEKGAQR